MTREELRDGVNECIDWAAHHNKPLEHVIKAIAEHDAAQRKVIEAAQKVCRSVGYESVEDLADSFTHIMNGYANHREQIATMQQTLDQQARELERVRAALGDLLREAVILSDRYLQNFKDWPSTATIQGWDKARWLRALEASKKARHVLEAKESPR